MGGSLFASHTTGIVREQIVRLVLGIQYERFPGWLRISPVLAQYLVQSEDFRR
jgi:hypothetical protein